MRILIALTFTMLLPATVLAKDATPVDPDKKICRELESTGSLLNKRVCHTVADWAAIDEQNRKGANDFDKSRENSAPRR